jgi:hypothetical protein
MGRGIAIRPRAVAGDGNQLAGPHDAGANRHFITGLRLPRGCQSFAHPTLVLFK